MEIRKILPKLAVTGYRGIWGESLDERIAFEYAEAYAKMVASFPGATKRVIVGRDARSTGPQIFASVKEALEKENIEVVNAGIILLVKKLDLSGGVMITASHNPEEYNGIKFIVAPGRLTNEGEVATIEKFRAGLSEEEKIPSSTHATLEKVDNREFRKIHVDKILKHVDTNLIRSKKFKVTLDPVNGAGSIITPELLKELGCEVNIINAEQNGTFAHPPEPMPQHLSQISQAVVENKSDIGFAQDPDADRLVVVDEHGVIASEEHTLVLVIKNVLAKDSGDVVINLATSSMSEDVAREFGRKTFRSKVGEANVVAKMFETGAPIGGEGGGAAIYPKINTARDSLVCIGLILELMAKENKKISEIVASLPKYFMKKDKIPVTENVNIIYNKLKIGFPDAKVNELDGVRFDFPDSSWLGVRASITEPIVRIFGEAKDEKRIEALFAEAELTLKAK